VEVKRKGRTDYYSADFVVVACGAINSAALLLRSTNDKHPQGLANRSGVVGSHYMGHVNSVQMAVSKCANPTVFQKTLSVNDFYLSSKESERPCGPHIICRQARPRSSQSGRPRDCSGLYPGPEWRVIRRTSSLPPKIYPTRATA